MNDIKRPKPTTFQGVRQFLGNAPNLRGNEIADVYQDLDELSSLQGYEATEVYRDTVRSLQKDKNLLERELRQVFYYRTPFKMRAKDGSLRTLRWGMSHQTRALP